MKHLKNIKRYALYKELQPGIRYGPIDYFNCWERVYVQNLITAPRTFGKDDLQALGGFITKWCSFEWIIL